MSEGAPKASSNETKSKRSPTLEAGMFAAALLAMQCGEAKPLEIEPYTPWHIGVQDNIRQAVEHDTIEHATMYVRFTDGSGMWTSPVEGDLGSVSINMRVEKDSVAQERRTRVIEKVCRIHLHEAEIYKEFAQRKKVQPSNPPSDIDIINTRDARNYYAQAGLRPEQVVHAVADVRGIWYYRPLSDAERQKYHTTPSQNIVASAANHKPQPDWYRAYANFVLAHANKTFDFSKEFPKLRLAYQTYLGGDVRFVPYGKINYEPACAGVNYKLEKETLIAQKSVHERKTAKK